jgi:hypothetical protein
MAYCFRLCGFSNRAPIAQSRIWAARGSGAVWWGEGQGGVGSFECRWRRPQTTFWRLISAANTVVRCLGTPPSQPIFLRWPPGLLDLLGRAACQPTWASNHGVRIVFTRDASDLCERSPPCPHGVRIDRCPAPRFRPSSMPRRPALVAARPGATRRGLRHSGGRGKNGGSRQRWKPPHTPLPRMSRTIFLVWLRYSRRNFPAGCCGKSALELDGRLGEQLPRPTRPSGWAFGGCRASLLGQ